MNVPLGLITNKFGLEKCVQSFPEEIYRDAMPKDLLDKASQSDLYVINNYAKIILAKTDDAYKAEQDKFIKGVQSLGYNQVVAWYNTDREKNLKLHNQQTK